MGTTLSNGYKLPQTRDPDWWEQLEDNIQRLNDHAHDGTDSNKINSNNVLKLTTTIDDTSWGSDLGGSTYQQSITMPAGVTFDNCVMLIYDTDNGDQIFPCIEKTGDDSFDIRVNDDTLNLKVIYA